MEQSFETSFPKDYREADIKRLLSLVLSGKFCQLLSLPGGGKATVLKLLAYNKALQKFHLGKQSNATIFKYFNLLELPNFEQPTIDRFLLLALQQEVSNETIEQFNNDSLIISEKLKETVNQIINNNNQSLVFLFDHFDEFQNKLDRQFFQRMRTLRSLGKYKFSAVFGTRRDLAELVDEQILKEFYDFFIGNTVYMKLYDQEASDFMFSQIENVLGKKLKKTQKESLIEITGGHTKLLKICAENVLTSGHPVPSHAEFISASHEILNQVQNDMLDTPIINASLLELWHFLTPAEQRILINVALNKPFESENALNSLINFGLLQQCSNDNNVNNVVFTIPLFAEFVKKQSRTMKQLSTETIAYNPDKKEIAKGQTVISDLLSSQEFRLLKFCLQNPDRILEREEIINGVWQESKSIEGVTDQALDQLVFRLRKKIEDEPNNPKHLLTIKGRGIRFIP